MILQNLKYQCIKGFNEEEFLNAILDWVENTNDLRYRMEIEETDFEGEVTYRDQRKTLQIIDSPKERIIAAQHTGVDAVNTVWKLSAVYHGETNEIYLQLSDSSTSQENYIRAFKKPDLIDELIDMGKVRTDNEVYISYKPHSVEPSRTQELASIIKHVITPSLPVVYISQMAYGQYPINAEDLADELAGIAHVFVQKGESVPQELKKIHGIDKSAVNGAIAIYYPKSTIRTTLLLTDGNEKKTRKDILRSVNYYHRSQDYGTLTTYDAVASVLIERRNSSLLQEKKRIEQKLSDTESENASLLMSADDDMEQMKRRIEWLTKQNEKLQMENDQLKRQVRNSDRKPLLYAGETEEIFPGEIRALLLKILKEAGLQENSRRADVVQDILAANEDDGCLERRHEELKSLFLGYRDLTPDLRRRLENLGFTITSDGKHHKLSYGNGKYGFVIPKSSSDIRAGKNAASIIIKSMM